MTIANADLGLNICVSMGLNNTNIEKKKYKKCVCVCVGIVCVAKNVALDTVRAATNVVMSIHLCL